MQESGVSFLRGLIDRVLETLSEELDRELNEARHWG